MPEGKEVWDVGASESQAVMVRIGVVALPRKGAAFRLVLDHEKGAEQLNPDLPESDFFSSLTD